MGKSLRFRSFTPTFPSDIVYVVYLNEALRNLFSSPLKIVVTMHRDPDADAIGSSLAWAGFLRKKGHSVTVISPTEVPHNLRWMYGADTIVNFEDKEGVRPHCKALISDADLVCCLDFSAMNRLKDMAPLVQQTRTPILMIDHHIDPEPFATYQISDPAAAATAQLIYSLILEWDSLALDAAIAECLYAGVMTDTGSFRHNSTTREVHLMVADLMLTGFSVNKVHRLIFDTSPLSRLRMLGHALSTIKVLPEFRTSYMVLCADELEKFNSGLGDTDGIVNYGLQVDDVVMTALFIQRNREIKISFRSVENFSVRDLANKHFSGGGHKNAAGGRSNLTLSATIEKFLGILPHYQEQLLEVSK